MPYEKKQGGTFNIILEVADIPIYDTLRYAVRTVDTDHGRKVYVTRQFLPEDKSRWINKKGGYVMKEDMARNFANAILDACERIDETPEKTGDF